MPELPEVETIRLGLQKYLVGHIIEQVEVRLGKMVHGDVGDIIGVGVVGVRRFGKGLVIDLSNGYALAIHVKMTGQLIYQGTKVPKSSHISKEKVGKVPNKFTHVIFHLDKGGVLYYNDLRQFGWIKIVKTNELRKVLFFKELGPEPFQSEFSLGYFKKLVRSSSAPIKPLLMDQQKIAGIGNIYANEAVFDARIAPTRKARTLSEEEIKQLYQSILKVLKKGLHYGGTSEHHFVNALGEEGNYQKHFLVYGRKGKQCLRCGLAIQKITQAGRGTYFCPNCQK